MRKEGLERWLGVAAAALLVAAGAVLGVALMPRGLPALALPNPEVKAPAQTSAQWGGYLDPAALARLAQALGLTPEALRTQLQAGKTLAQVATEKGVAVDKVVETLLAPYQETLQLRVKYGYLPQERADQLLAQERQRVSFLVQQPLPGAQGSPETVEEMTAHCSQMMAEHHGGTGMGDMTGGMMGGGSGGMGQGMMGGGSGAMGQGMMGGPGNGRTRTGMMGGGGMGGGMMGGWNW